MNFYYKDALELFNDRDWLTLSNKQKSFLLQTVENHMAELIGRKPCEVISESMGIDYKKGTTLGYFKSGTDSIFLNSDALENSTRHGSDYRKCLDTIIHEGRHCTQEKAIRGEIDLKDVSPEVIESWRENLKPGNYIRPEKNIMGYYNQPIEKDAREFGKKGVEMVINDRQVLKNSQSIQKENSMNIA